MKVTVEIDESLLHQALQLGGNSSKKDVINTALAELVRQLKRRKLLELRGQIQWEGDLGALRSNAPSSGEPRKKS